MYEKIRDYARAHGMLDKGDVVIAGISGGADSVCLLCVLLELKKEYDLEVRAVHVNHGTRGAAAAADHPAPTGGVAERGARGPAGTGTGRPGGLFYAASCRSMTA